MGQPYRSLSRATPHHRGSARSRKREPPRRRIRSTTTT
jgi:hypothetical protein